MMLHQVKFFFFLSFLTAAVTLTAQTGGKYGHMNLGNLLESLPDSKQANIVLEAFAAKYTITGDSLGKVLEIAAQKFQQDYQAGVLPAAKAQEQYAALEQQQAALDKFEKDSQQKVAEKRDQLLKPIMEKLYNAITAVGKENGFLMIFDTSTGATLYAMESEDVTPLVKAKLGL
jgi:outer membrane protein